MDLAQFLRERLAEDERIARAACWDEQSDVWTARPPQKSYERYTVVDYLDDGVVAVTPENADDDGVGRHIAAWDPARVLAEVEAKLGVLETCQTFLHENENGPDPCARGVLRSLARPYRRRPDFDPAWLDD